MLDKKCYFRKLLWHQLILNNDIISYCSLVEDDLHDEIHLWVSSLSGLSVENEMAEFEGLARNKVIRLHFSWKVISFAENAAKCKSLKQKKP